MKYLISIMMIVTTIMHAKSETIKKFYEDGTIKSATSYKNGKKNGSEHIYYPDGAILQSASKYVHGRLHGLQQKYNSSAMLIKEEDYKHGKLDGMSRYYKDGLLNKEITFRNGKVEGIYREFYPTGITKIEIRWERGIAVEGYLYNKVGERKPMSSEKLQSISPNDIVAKL